MSETWEKIEKAHSAMSDLMRQAVNVKRLFEDAGESVPNVLSRMFGEGIKVGASGASQHRIKYPPLDSPPRPEDVPVEWLWIPLKDVSPTPLVLGILRKSERPLAPKDVIERVEKLRPNGGFNHGSIMNIGPRLESQGIITRASGEWQLLQPKTAPVIGEDAVWWDVDHWGKQEMAAHRRIVIRHVLKVTGGLQIVQLAKQLRDSGLCRAPITKDLLKADMAIMQKTKAAKRTLGHSKKWVLVDEVGPKN